MGKIQGLAGRPLINQKAEVRAEQVIKVNVLVKNAGTFGQGVINVKGPGGSAQITMQQAVTDFAVNMYHIMKASKQKRMIISMNDLSAVTELAKHLQIVFMEIPDESMHSEAEVVEEIKEDEDTDNSQV